MTSYIPFLLKAKQNTYANSSGQVASSRTASYDLEYKEKDLRYTDTYLGTHLFGGQECIYDKNEPVWNMVYYGQVLSENFKSKVLKSALMLPSIELPYRGPARYVDGDYLYTFEVQGEFENFHGLEKIFYKDELVYELRVVGGAVVDQHFD
jgi:hypothetical protein